MKREAYVAATYANDSITIYDLRDKADLAQSGDYVLINSRANDDRTTFKGMPVVVEIQRDNATFCIVRQIP